MSSDSSSGSSTVARAPNQTNGISGYIHGFFGMSRNTDPIKIPSRLEVNNQTPECMSPLTPTSDDWTFGIFRKYSDDGLNRSQSGSPGLNSSFSKALPNVNQSTLNNESSSPAKTGQTVVVGEITSRVHRDSDIYNPVGKGSDAACAKDVVDSVSNVGQEFGKGAILSAYISQAGIADMTKDKTTKSQEVLPGCRSGNKKMVTDGVPNIECKRRSLFDNEKLAVNRKEMNLIAPNEY